MARTVYLGEAYRIENNKLIRWDYADGDGNWRESNIRIGALVQLYSLTNVSPNAIREGRAKPVYHISMEHGVPGNSNPGIRRTTGWRGTSNDVSRDAHGICKIQSIYISRGRVAVRVGNPIKKFEG